MKYLSVEMMKSVISSSVKMLVSELYRRTSAHEPHEWQCQFCLSSPSLCRYLTVLPFPCSRKMPARDSRVAILVPYFSVWAKVKPSRRPKLARCFTWPSKLAKWGYQHRQFFFGTLFFFFLVALSVLLVLCQQFWFLQCVRSFSCFYQHFWVFYSS